MTKFWYLFTNGDFTALDVKYETMDFTTPKSFKINSEKPASEVDVLGFNTSDELVQYVLDNGPQDGKAHHYVNQKIHEIKNNTLNKLTTQADQFYNDLVGGHMPNPDEIIPFFNQLVDHLESTGGKVIEDKIMIGGLQWPRKKKHD